MGENKPGPPSPSSLSLSGILSVFLDQVIKYGLATVLAVSLITLMVYERIEVDREQTSVLSRVIENQSQILRLVSETRQYINEDTSSHQELVRVTAVQIANNRAAIAEMQRTLDLTRLDIAKQCQGS